MTTKQTTCTNILRGVAYFIAALKDDPNRIRTASIEVMLSSIQNAEDLFETADTLQIPVVKLLEIVCHFEAALINKGWEVSRSSDDCDPKDPFINAVATLLSSDFATSAAKYVRIGMVCPNKPLAHGGTVQSDLVRVLMDYVVNQTTIANVVAVVERMIANNPLISTTTCGDLFGAHHTPYPRFAAQQFTPNS